MKWTVKVEPENEHDERALRQVIEGVREHGLSRGIITIADAVKNDDMGEYKEQIAAQVTAMVLSAYLKTASDKR